jgi:hypothetical protein
MYEDSLDLLSNVELKACIWPIFIKDMDIHTIVLMNTRIFFPCLLFEVCFKGYMTTKDPTHNSQWWILQKINMALEARFFKDSLELTNWVDITWAHTWYEDMNSRGWECIFLTFIPAPNIKFQRKAKFNCKWLKAWKLYVLDDSTPYIAPMHNLLLHHLSRSPKGDPL